MTAVVRTVAKRFTVGGLIIFATAGMILLAMVMLASGPIYSDAAARSGLQRTFTDADPDESTIEVSIRIAPHRYDLTDEVTTAAIARALGPVDADIERSIESETFAITGDGPKTRLAIFRSIDDIEQHASLIDGNWPAADSERLDVAITDLTAAALELDVADVVELTTRRAEAPIDVAISGVFTIDDPSDPFWFDDPLAVQGTTESPSFITHGPFVVPTATLVDALPTRLIPTWRIVPTPDRLRVADAAPLRSAVDSLERTLEAALADATTDATTASTSDFSAFEVSTGLVRLLGGAERSLTITRSSVIGLLLQLGLLAGYALALTAGLLVGTRRGETSLVVARGAGTRHVMAVTLIEAVLLTVPSVAIAPWIAAQLLRLLNHVGPLADIGLAIDPVVVGDAYIAAGVAAMIAIPLLVWPAFRTAREFSGATHRRRTNAVSGSQRTGIDLALVALALAGFWQLAELGTERAGRLRGRFDVDPLVIAAPAIGMLAGTVLALRIVPLLARMAERSIPGRRGVLSALTAWQIARRPLRHGRAALLLIMATAIGIFGVTYSSTWLTSQADQAAHQIGADLRVHPNRRTNDSIGDLYLASAHEAIVGVGASMAVERRIGSLPGADESAQFVLLDAAEAGSVVRGRDAAEFELLATQLVESRPQLATIELPGRPRQIGVRIAATEISADGVAVDPLDSEFDGRLSLVVIDEASMLHRIELGPIERTDSAGSAERVVGDLVTPAASDALLEPRYPVSIVAFEIRTLVPDLPVRTVDIVVEGVDVPDSSGGWLSVPLDHDDWDGELNTVRGLNRNPRVLSARQNADGHPQLVFETGAAFTPILTTFGLRPARSVYPDSLPVVVTDAWLAENDRMVGEVTRIDALRLGGRQVRIAGSLPAIPTVDPLVTQAIVVDLPSVQAMSLEVGAPFSAATEYWLEAADPGSVADVLARAPFESVETLSLDGRTVALRTDPVARGTIGAFSIGFIASALFAALGFAAAASVSARERMTEFALMRALGLSGRQLGAWLALEQSVLVLLSLLAGATVGLGLTATILPLISLTQSGNEVVPSVQVVYPWATIAALVAGLLIVLAIVVVVMSTLLRRRGLGSLLRMGETQ